MMFVKDDIVIYGSSGLCKVLGITEKEFGETSFKYYELIPVYDNKSALYVPVTNQSLVNKMHKILSSNDIKEVIKTIYNEDYIWIEDETERKEYYKKVIEIGDRYELVKAIKAVYYHSKKQEELKKKVHICDERFLKDAQKMLFDEIAYVLEIERNQVLEYIKKGC